MAARTRKSTTVDAAVAAPTTRPGLLDGVDAKLAVRAASLADKAPSDLHHDMAAWMTALTGVEVSPKMAQVVANLRMDYQRSEANKSRETYRGLDEVSVAKRSEHMTLANLEAKALRAQMQAEADAALQAKAEKAAAAKAKRASSRKAPAVQA